MDLLTSSLKRTIEEGLCSLEVLIPPNDELQPEVRLLKTLTSQEDCNGMSGDEIQKRRSEFGDLTKDPEHLILSIATTILNCLTVLLDFRSEKTAIINKPLIQATEVLHRLEQKVAFRARTIASQKVKGLYVILDPEATNGRPVLEIANLVLEGGASIIQLRDKSNDKSEVLTTARCLKEMCRRYMASFVSNDSADLAFASDADFLHLGQTDLPVAVARKILKYTQAIGRSNNGIGECLESQSQGADYLAVGAIFPTNTMGKSGRTAVGLDMISKVKDTISRPVVAIGGINSNNIESVVRAGADCVCVVSAVTTSRDPKSATALLVSLMEKSGARHN